MILTLKDYKQAKGLVVVIDVLRAFTTSSILFNKGIKEIYLVKDLNIALRTKEAYKEKVIIFGEKGGRKIKGFDYENSPYQMNSLNLDITKNYVLRTSSGTKGALLISKLSQVKEIIAGSFTTAAYLKKYLNGKEVDFLITGSRTPDGGQEDIALAEYLIGDIELDKAYKKVKNCFSTKNWIKNLKDVDVAIDYNFNFIQRIYGTKNLNVLILKKEIT